MICAAALARSRAVKHGSGLSDQAEPADSAVFSAGRGTTSWPLRRTATLRLARSVGGGRQRPGAGALSAPDLVAKSAPDGYPLLITHNAIAINQTL